MKKIAIMQPYFLPYLTYFQLMAHVDEWIILDNVAYQARGFINRNTILLNQKPHRFTLPVRHGSQNQLISEIELNEPAQFCDHFLTLIYHAYHKAPEFQPVFACLQNICNFPSQRLVDVIAHCHRELSRYLNIETPRLSASKIPIDPQLKKSDRILALCQARQASHYINLPGGRALYQSEDFSKQGIELSFIENRQSPYPQFSQPFIANLSIIDVLMFNACDRVQTLLKDFELCA